MEIGKFYKVKENSRTLIGNSTVKITEISYERGRVIYLYIDGLQFMSSCSISDFRDCTIELSSLECELL